MFQNSLHNDQTDFPIVTANHTYEPAAALLHMESLNMLLQEAASAYPTDIPDYNE